MENNIHCQFVLYTTHNKDEQIQVIVYKAKQQLPVVSIVYNQRESEFKPNTSKSKTLLGRLKTTDLLIEPNPTATLVLEPPHLRIDTQPVPNHLNTIGVWRNIHIQNGIKTLQKSFAVVKIQKGAQLCYTVNYENMLLQNLKKGLVDSLNARTKFVIEVSLMKRNKRIKSTWEIVNLSETEINQLRSQIEHRLQKKQYHKENMLKYSTNSFMWRTKRKLITSVVAAINKHALKIVEKEGTHIAAKIIPVVSAFVGVFFGVTREMKGDVVGCFQEVASGVLADIPGIGTAASAVIDVSLLVKDIKEAMDKDKEEKELLEHEIFDLKTENEKIKSQLSQCLQDSPIYGGDFDENSFYDESETGYVDEISRIHIRIGDFITGIQVEYKAGKMQPYHGCQDGKLKSFDLEPFEKIIAVEISTHRGAIKSLGFYTDMGRSEHFGQAGENTELYELFDGDYLAAIKGYDNFKDNNGCITRLCPSLPGDIKVLPPIGFCAKF